ncbi:hypothetical protein MMC16_005910 [Acarospora aff. strigata]|nr:hypothetical protein [Acarospora aff. strigata]
MKGRLSTGSYSGTLGQQWVGELAVPGTTKALNFADLISPTWGLSNEFEIVIPPPEPLTFALEWAVCSHFGGSDGKPQNGAYFGAPLTYAIFGPPHMLVPAKSMNPAIDGTVGQPQAAPVTRSVPLVPQSTVLSGQRRPPPHDPGQSALQDAQKSPQDPPRPPQDPQKPPQGPQKPPKDTQKPQDAKSRPQEISPSPDPGNTQTPGSTDPSNQKGAGSEPIISASPAKGTVVSANKNPATISEQRVSFDPTESIVVDSAPHAAAPITVAGNTVLVNPNNVIVKGSTLASGAPAITVGGTPVSLGPSRTLVVGSSNIALSPPQAPSTPQPAQFSIGGETFTTAVFAATITLADTRITSGGPGVTILGTPISLAPSGVIGTSRGPLTASGPQPRTSIYTVGDQTFTANPAAIPIASATLNPDGTPITVSGNPISLGPGGTLVIGTSSMLLSMTASSVYTVGDQTFTATNPSAVSVVRTTLTPGGADVTVAGTVVSLASGATLVIGGSSVGGGSVGRSSVERSSVGRSSVGRSSVTGSSVPETSVGTASKTDATGAPVKGDRNGRRERVPFWQMVGGLGLGVWVYIYN